jgi:hypothetical protein
LTKKKRRFTIFDSIQCFFFCFFYFCKHKSTIHDLEIGQIHPKNKIYVLCGEKTEIDGNNHNQIWNQKYYSKQPSNIEP